MTPLTRDLPHVRQLDMLLYNIRQPRRLQDRSKYMPHQGQQECDRRTGVRK